MEPATQNKLCNVIVLTGSEVKSSYAESDERPMAVCELGGFVAVESENPLL